MLLRVRNQLTVRRCERQLVEHNERLELAVRDRTRELEASRLEVLDRLALVAEFRDDDTKQHAQRVGRSAAVIAAVLELASEVQELLGPATALHDIGKIAVPDSILHKPGRAHARRVHSDADAHHHRRADARGSGSPVLQNASRIALTHHERFDGTGYPAGLACEAIPIEGRVAAVADVFDALTSDRVYRPAFERDVALEMMREESGKQFDPVVLAVLLNGPLAAESFAVAGV